MSRRRVVSKREIQPDTKYNNKLLAKFINQLMSSGKKTVAEKIVYGALSIIEKKLKLNPVVVFERAIENIRPLVEVKSKRIGGSTFQVPIEIRLSRSMTLARRWLVKYSSKRSESNMMLKLAGEILDASDDNTSTGSSKGKGFSVKKREDTHRMAEANKAFSHYRF